MEHDCVTGIKIHESTKDLLDCEFCHIRLERSKREDDKKYNPFICENCHGYKINVGVCRCGALNIVETQ